VELGAGVGAAGLALAALGARVTLTDKPGLLPLLRGNIARNWLGAGRARGARMPAKGLSCCAARVCLCRGGRLLRPLQLLPISGTGARCTDAACGTTSWVHWRAAADAVAGHRAHAASAAGPERLPRGCADAAALEWGREECLADARQLAAGASVDEQSPAFAQHQSYSRVIPGLADTSASDHVDAAGCRCTRLGRLAACLAARELPTLEAWSPQGLGSWIPTKGLHALDAAIPHTCA